MVPSCAHFVWTEFGGEWEGGTERAARRRRLRQHVVGEVPGGGVRGPRQQVSAAAFPADAVFRENDFPGPCRNTLYF